MTFTLAELMDIIPIFFSVGAFIYAFFVNRRKDTDQRFADGTARMNRHNDRLTKLEQKIDALPGKDDVHALQMTLASLVGDLKAMNATMTGMSEGVSRLENIVTRHEDHLRENR